MHVLKKTARFTIVCDLGHRERFLSWLSYLFITWTYRWNVAASRISGMVWLCCQTIQRGEGDLFLPQRILPVHIT
jgi:hypothetical protein